MQENKRIFLDYAAGTPVSPEALSAYVEATGVYANPQALHTEGLTAARTLDAARKDIAKLLQVRASEIVCTAGGTEANNLALAGYLSALESSGRNIADCHVIISAIEHPSVYAVLDPFVARGLLVSEVAPKQNGEIAPSSIADVLTNATVLVSVALVNSEIGTVQPLHAIAKVLAEYNGRNNTQAVLHTDASQSAYVSMTPHSLGVDLLTLDSGKVYGPRGVGVLYVRHGVRLVPVLHGGSQEGGLRPGTEHVAGIVGFGAALRETAAQRESETERLGKFRNLLMEALLHTLPDCVCNGTANHQSPHILNISIPNIDAEYVAMYLDQRGIALSTKSACLERADAEVSHVVAALCTGDDAWRARTMLRMSFGRDTDSADIPRIVALVHEAVQTYRGFSA